MGSGEAKRFRQTLGSATRHGDAFWVQEKHANNAGLALLQKMGWQHGMGLGKTNQGATAHVKTKLKKDNAGIGANRATRDETFRASQDLFNSLLQRLGGGGADATEHAPELGDAATTVKGAVAKRALGNRFRRAKDTSMASAADLSAIFGRKAGEPPAAVASGGVAASRAAAAVDDGLQTTTSAVSVNDYFAQRRMALGLAPSTAGASGVGASSRSGFSLDDQARFAEEQTARAYTGRGGLGSGSPQAAAPVIYTSQSWGAASASVPAADQSAATCGDEAADETAARKAARKADKAARRAAKAARKARKAAERGAGGASPQAEAAAQGGKVDARLARKADKAARKAAREHEAHESRKGERKKRRKGSV